MSGELTTPIIAAEFATTGIILANQGDTTATTNLSLMDKEGKRVPKNKAKSQEWYRKSCDNGYQPSCDEYVLLSR